MRKIYLETFGCQMNVLDSELVQNQLTRLGYSFTPDAEAADVVLYNTCSVRELAEQKVLSRLGILRKRKQERKEGTPDLIVGVIGCMAERDGAGMLKRLPHVDLLCGPSELDKLPALLENVVLTGRQQHALAGNTSRRSKTLQAAEEDGLELLDLSRSFSPIENKYQAYVRVVRGCNKFCTYCVVPYTRGPEVSRSPQAILHEARKLVDAGALEITLLGQTVNHYVHEERSAVSTPTGPAAQRTTFAELLTLLHDQLPDLPRLRFITSFPADFGDDILHAIARSPRICRYLHIPAQSGSNRILKMMNRGYTVEQYRDLLERARRIVPDMAFASDFIVGFPTETDEDYQATRDLLAWARYKNSFIFKYSPRPGTTAIKRFEDDVPDAVKRARNNDLLALQNAVSEAYSAQFLGQTVSVLCEGPSGWKEPERDSKVAGSSVELGTSLAQGLARTTKAAKAPGSNGRPAATGAVSGDDRSALTSPTVQLTGRTTADQIVVFDGPAELEGQIVPVHVDRVHALTAFGTTEKFAKFRDLGNLDKIASPASS